MYKTLLLLAVISYVSAQAMVSPAGTVVSRTVENTNSEEWNCCEGSNNHMVVTRGACATNGRRAQVMTNYPYCIEKNSRRRMQVMVPQCKNVGSRRLSKTQRRNQVMVKLCPTDTDGFQCAINPKPTTKCAAVTYTVSVDA